MINETTLRQSRLSIRFYVFVLRNVFQILGFINLRLASRLALKVFLSPPATKASRWERKFERMGKVQFVDIGERRLRLLCHGNGEKKALLIHGWGSRSTHLGSYAESLLEENYTVYSLDGPAHGESSGNSTDMMEYARTIALVAEHLNSIDAVVGHSFGAACTLLAIKKFGLQVKKMVLVSCFSDAIFITEMFSKFFRLKQSVVCEMRKLLERRYSNDFSWEKVAPNQLIQKIECPILLIHDEDDEEVPFFHALTLQSANENVQLFKTRKQGHRKILRDRSGIDAATSFLGKEIAVVTKN